MKETIATILRLILKAGGGALVAKGIGDDATVEAVIGAVIAIWGAVWGWYAAKEAAKNRGPADPSGNISGPLIALLFAIGFAITLAGCATQRPPSATEIKYFDIKTNTVEVVAYVTNTVPATATTPAVETVTPIVAKKETYDFTPNQSAGAVGTTGGAIGSIWGVGPLVAGIIALLFSTYGWVRSHRAASEAQFTAEQLAQIIETGRQILLTVPNGAEYEAAYKAWMVKHQAETQTIAAIAELAKTAVDNEKARGAAQTIINLIQAAKV